MWAKVRNAASLPRRALRALRAYEQRTMSLAPAGSSATYLGRDLILAQTRWGGHVVVPGYNVDVSIGIIRDGIHEPWTTRLVQELLREGQTYINVGANFGYYTCLGARIVGSRGKVIAIEANPHVFSVLMKTILFAGIVDRVTAYNRAAYVTSGCELEFTFDYQYIGGGHIKHDAERSAVQATSPFWTVDGVPALLDGDGKWISSQGLLNFFNVKTLRLDDITQGVTADLIHCDVEQAEPYVIMGAVDLLARSPKCKLIFEWSGYAYHHGSDNYKEVVQQMWALLEGHGYVIRHLVPTIHPDGSIEVSGRLSFDDLLAGEHGDYLAVRAADDPWG